MSIILERMNSLLFNIINSEDMNWLPEWIRYHLAIGFDYILIYDNNNGLEYYPMSDEIISYCTGENAKVKIMEKRNVKLDFNYEFYTLPNEYDKFDFKIMLKSDEFICAKEDIHNINDLLLNENTNLNVEIIPFDIINNVETLNLNKYRCYFPKCLKHKNSEKTIDTNKIYIKKILSVQ